MKYNANSPEEYISLLPEERKAPVKKLRKMILDNLPKGFEETMSYGMIGYVVPHSRYPEGYHCNPELPLPFLNIASQKNFIALYHSGIYADPELQNWFVEQYRNRVPSKLDIGKSCIRFKNLQQIPYDLIGELCAKISPEEWVETYEKAVKHRKRG